MKSTIIAATLLSALSLTSATTINKVRQSSPVPTYSVGIVLSDGSQGDLASVDGSVFYSFNPTYGPYLTHAEIDNAVPAGSATCVARDQYGNQVRAFGGPNFGGVEAVDFVEADGKQIFTLSCNPAF